MKIYFAGPLFSEAERDWIRSTIRKIESLAAAKGIQINVIFPYDLITVQEIQSLGDRARREIFHRCKSHLLDAEILIALLDGAQVDDGTAWEIRYFCRGKPDRARSIGARTDFRQAGKAAKRWSMRWLSAHATGSRGQLKNCWRSWLKSSIKNDRSHRNPWDRRSMA